MTTTVTAHPSILYALAHTFPDDFIQPKMVFSNASLDKLEKNALPTSLCDTK